jgi:tetratricopeptide (TPR) repeat protein
MNRLKVARRALVSSAILVGSLAPGVEAASTASGKAQLAFGVDMARRGLWSEALFRFEQARRLDPDNVSILNNLAVCYEAGSRFEEALATYREAARLAPENRIVKQNYSRFTEFYQGYRPRKPAAPAPGTASPASEGATPAAPAPASDAPPSDAPPGVAAPSPEPPPPADPPPASAPADGGAR